MKRRIAIGAVLVLATCGAFVGIKLRPQHFDNVVSIKTLPGYQDPELLKRAWALPAAATYQNPPLSQPNPSACGPTALANMLRSTGSTEATSASEAAEAGCFAGFCFGGLTLDQVAATVKNPKWHVTVLRDLTLEQLRDELRHANDPSRRYLANFHRGPLFGQGGGHHSPIGGYLEDLDLVFVIDVNKSYGPWLVPTERLHEATGLFDPSSGKPRGLVRIEL